MYLRDGCILIGIRKYFPAHILSITELNVEHLFICFSVCSSAFIVGSVYFPALSFFVLFEAHINSNGYLISKYSKHIFKICGDYNLPDVYWAIDVNGLIYSSLSSVRASCIPEAFATNCLFKKNNVKNINNSSLNLVFFSSKLLLVEKSHEPVLSIDLYYHALNILLPISKYVNSLL